MHDYDSISAKEDTPVPKERGFAREIPRGSITSYEILDNRNGQGFYSDPISMEAGEPIDVEVSVEDNSRES